MSKFNTAYRYLKYFVHSKNKHGVHSPFVYQLLTEVLLDHYPFYAYQELSELRKKLLASKETITISDFGAGSKVFKSNIRKVGDIVKHGISTEKQAKLLFRLVNYFNPGTILELGTSVGLTTLYLSRASNTSKIYTVEGCPNIASFANKLFKEQRATNIQLINGNFDEVLQHLPEELQGIDFLYIDGNHRKQSTINYFEQLLPRLHPNSIIIFDDIHWNKDMEQAWNYLRALPYIRLSIDLFFVGLVFLRTEQKEKEHFVLRY